MVYDVVDLVTCKDLTEISVFEDTMFIHIIEILFLFISGKMENYIVNITVKAELKD